MRTSTCCNAPCTRWSMRGAPWQLRTWHGLSDRTIRLGCPLHFTTRAYHQHNHGRFYRGPNNGSYGGGSYTLWNSANSTKTASHGVVSSFYAAFMGSSTPFTSTPSSLSSPLLTKGAGSHEAQQYNSSCDCIELTTEHVTAMEKEPLAHCAPGRINDHVCILMVKLLRWIADRLFRERYLHRATMLKTLTPAAAAAAMTAALLRLVCLPRRTLPAATAFLSPFVPKEKHVTGDAAVSLPRDSTAAASTGKDSNKPTSHSKVSNTTATELRGVLSQLECHVAHWHILLAMADITAAERVAVAFAQLTHFTLCFFLFLLYPRMGFRLCGYLAEESSVVWTQMVNDIDLGKLEAPEVPPLAYSYWHLRRPSEATQDATSESVTKSKEDDNNTRNAEQVDTNSVAATKESADATVTQHAGSKQLRKAHIDKPAVISPLSLREVVLLIRSDEMVYRDLNHAMADALDRQPQSPNTLRNRFLRYCGVKE